MVLLSTCPLKQAGGSVEWSSGAVVVRASGSGQMGGLGPWGGLSAAATGTTERSQDPPVNTRGEQALSRLGAAASRGASENRSVTTARSRTDAAGTPLVQTDVFVMLHYG